MKRCPTCNKTFTDQNLTFCIDDGTPLVTLEPPADETPGDEATVIRSPSAGDEGTVAKPSGYSGPADDDAAPAYQPPGSYSQPGHAGERTRRTWPWILAVLLIVAVIGGLAVAGVLLVRSIVKANADIQRRNDEARNLNQRNSNTNLNEGNTNSDAESADDNENSNDDSDADDSTPPTDREEVLADLKNLEDEWTVANINADKKKLNRILADDYVGIVRGKPQGKAEYLKTVERDTTIQHWELEDLKVSLNGDRASLTGVLRLDVKDDQGQVQQLGFRFTDKFVWRDGRWQATASEVDPLPVKPGTTV